MNIRHNLEAARMASFSANEKSAFVGKLLFCFHLMPNMNDFRRNSMWLSVLKKCGHVGRNSSFFSGLGELLLVLFVVSDSLRVVV